MSYVWILSVTCSRSALRLLSVQSENVALRADLSQVQADLSSQVETRRQTYREQLRKLQDEHQTTVETLQGQLTRVEEQLFNLQSQNSKQEEITLMIFCIKSGHKYQNLYMETAGNSINIVKRTVKAFGF